MLRFSRITLAVVSITFAGANVAHAAQEKQSNAQPNLLTIYRSTHLNHHLATRCRIWGPAASSDRPRCGEALYAGGTNGGFDG